MINHNWLVTEDGDYRAIEIADRQDHNIDQPYRLYRLLTEIENILDRESDDRVRLQQISPLVRRLLDSCEWLQVNFLAPNPVTGWSVQTLYDEPDWPLTVQMVAWSPGAASPIHNHAAWGIVALLYGQEKNTFWQQSPTIDTPDRIIATGDLLLTPGDIICFTPDAIHQIAAIGDEPTISFNLYGATDYDRRYEFHPDLGTISRF